MSSRKARGEGGLLEDSIQARVIAARGHSSGLGSGDKDATSAARYRAASKAAKEGKIGPAYIGRRQANAVAHDELSRQAHRSIKKEVSNKKAYDRVQKVKKAKQKVKKAVNKAVKKVRGKK